MSFRGLSITLQCARSAAQQFAELFMQTHRAASVGDRLSNRFIHSLVALTIGAALGRLVDLLGGLRARAEVGFMLYLIACDVMPRVWVRG